MKITKERLCPNCNHAIVFKNKIWVHEKEGGKHNSKKMCIENMKYNKYIVRDTFSTKGHMICGCRHTKLNLDEHGKLRC